VTQATCPALLSWQRPGALRVFSVRRGPEGRSHDDGRAVTGQQAAGRHVLRVEEFLPCPAGRVWRALTDPDLIARWLMPNDVKLEAGHRFAMDSDPIRRCGLGGTGHCEVLACGEGKMLRIAWAAAEGMRGLDSAVTVTVAPGGAGTRLLIEHDGLHPCPYIITSRAGRAGRLPLLRPAHRRGSRHGRCLARCPPARLGGAGRRRS
jgi:uncharacterized protein YndB with AHSA1/START domain